MRTIGWSLLLVACGGRTELPAAVERDAAITDDATTDAEPDAEASAPEASSACPMIGQACAPALPKFCADDERFFVCVCDGACTWRKAWCADAGVESLCNHASCIGPRC